jgi:hypothetical protein
MSLREFTTAPVRATQPDDTPLAADGATIFDPLKYCIFTTLALLAWLVGPAVVVAVMSAMGLTAYWNARRAGLTRSRCVLGDTRLVMLYLAAAFLAGLGAVVWRFV